MWAGQKQLFSHNMGTQCAWLRRGMKYRGKKGLQGAFMCPSRLTQEGYSKCAGKTRAPESSGAKQMHEEGHTAPCGRKVSLCFNSECEGGLGCIWLVWGLCPVQKSDQSGQEVARIVRQSFLQPSKLPAGLWEKRRGAEFPSLCHLNAPLACRNTVRRYAFHLRPLLPYWDSPGMGEYLRLFPTHWLQFPPLSMCRPKVTARLI